MRADNEGAGGQDREQRNDRTKRGTAKSSHGNPPPLPVIDGRWISKPSTWTARLWMCRQRKKMGGAVALAPPMLIPPVGKEYKKDPSRQPAEDYPIPRSRIPGL